MNNNKTFSISRSRVAATSDSNRVLAQNLSYGYEFFLDVHCLSNEMASFFREVQTDHEPLEN